MFHVTILGSGSAGNCALVETPKCRLLIDGGLSCRQTTLRLRECGLEPAQIDGILLTHEHSDHARGLDVWCKQFSTPIYCNRLTAEILQRDAAEAGGKCVKKDWRIFTTGHDFQIGDLTIQNFPIPHDAVEPVGFVLHCDGAALGFLTDLGFATKLVYERVRQVHTLIIETNHDERLLMEDTKRPWSVKQRIMSRHGHLSNAAAGSVLTELLGSNLRRAVLGHLSRDCNTPELATSTVRAQLERVGGDKEVEVLCATQAAATPRMEVGRIAPAAVQPELIFPADRV